METATKQKLKKAIQEGELSAHRTPPLAMISAGLAGFACEFIASSSAWSSTPAVMFGCLNLSAFCVFGGLIWMDVQRVLARLDAPPEG